MDIKELIGKTGKDIAEIECLIKNLHAYLIEEENGIDLPTTILPAIEMITERIYNIRNNLIKIKSN